jgi:ketosteroid isomerase-like protein
MSSTAYSGLSPLAIKVSHSFLSTLPIVASCVTFASGGKTRTVGIALASALLPATTMKRRFVPKIILILAGALILTPCWSPTPVVAAVEFAPGVGADADRLVIKELVAAFNEAEAAVKKADLDALMKFYATRYNYHGLKRSDVRRVWEEVFLYYRDISSSHVFTELKLVQADDVRKAYVTCTGGLHGTEKETGKPITIDSWAREVHYLVKEGGAWRFLGNAGEVSPSNSPASAPHHPLF